MNPTELMTRAIQVARQGVAAGQSPFGCVIFRGGKILSECHNTVVATLDSTAHAEVNAIRKACQVVSHYHLEGATVATTCEPCPMCMSALHWARVKTVYYGATIEDATNAGFNELTIEANQLLRLGQSDVELIDNVLPEQCKELFDLWLTTGDPKRYCNAGDCRYQAVQPPSMTRFWPVM